MIANVKVTVERRFDHPRERVFRAWTEPSELSQWRGSPGWHVENARGELKPGGFHYHLKVRDKDPANQVGTEGIYTEYSAPDVFVSRERITGDPGIDPDTHLDLRVEFHDHEQGGTLVQISQGPYEPDVASWHGEGWERELGRLKEFLGHDAAPPRGVQAGEAVSRPR